MNVRSFAAGAAVLAVMGWGAGRVLAQSGSGKPEKQQQQQSQATGEQPEGTSEEAWQTASKEPKNAYQSVTSAIEALEANRGQEAKTALESGAESLRKLYAEGAGEIAAEIDRLSALISGTTPERQRQLRGAGAAGQQGEKGAQGAQGEGTVRRRSEQRVEEEVSGTGARREVHERTEVEETVGEGKPEAAKDAGNEPQQMGKPEAAKGAGVKPQQMGKPDAPKDAAKPQQTTEGGEQTQAGAIDFAQLYAAIDEHALYLDPDVQTKVKAAERSFQRGNHQAAVRDLGAARNELASDIALSPIESAYSRVLAAHAEVGAGRNDSALRLLRGVPMMLSNVQLTAPLVPIRFDLRLAANALESGNHERADTLVTQASNRVDQLLSEDDGRMAPRLKPIADALDRLEKRFDSGRRPKASEIRDVVRRTQTLGEELTS